MPGAARSPVREPARVPRCPSAAHSASPLPAARCCARHARTPCRGSRRRARCARCRPRTLCRVAPASRILRRLRRRSPRTPTHSRSTDCCSNSNTADIWRSRTGRVSCLRRRQSVRLATRAPSERPDRIVALPLASARQRERGFNQAQEIAARVSRQLRLPIARALTRIAGGPPQAALSWSERAANVRGAFAARADVHGARIALVDDVMTTGATLAEAARTLARAGAARVECWVVARTLRTGGG